MYNVFVCFCSRLEQFKQPIVVLATTGQGGIPPSFLEAEAMTPACLVLTCEKKIRNGFLPNLIAVKLSWTMYIAYGLQSGEVTW
jgi:hypothetical protein